jgi:hypothetical protein
LYIPCIKVKMMMMMMMMIMIIIIIIIITHEVYSKVYYIVSRKELRGVKYLQLSIAGRYISLDI